MGITEYINTLIVCGKADMSHYREDTFWAKVRLMEKLGIDIIKWLSKFISLSDFNGADLLMNLFSLLDYTETNSDLKIILDRIYNLIEDYSKIFVIETVYKYLLATTSTIRNLNTNDIKLICNRIDSCRVITCANGTPIILDKKILRIDKREDGFRLINKDIKSNLYSTILVSDDKIEPIGYMSLGEKIEFIESHIHKKDFSLIVKEINNNDVNEMNRIWSIIEEQGL